MALHLLSFDVRADFACFKKPDVNEGIILTYNCLHKPALLGILGAVVGLKGYSRKGEFPEYYQAFKNLSVGIEPLEGFHEKGNFNKTIIKYTNTVGYANADGNLIVTEQTLIRPGFRCYVLLDDAVEPQAKLYSRLINGETTYLPYLGKNEFAAWWDKESVIIYDFEAVEQVTTSFSVSSIFKKVVVVNEAREASEDFDFLDFTLKPDLFFYFERLPVGFDENLLQYQLAEFAYTNVSLKSSKALSSLYHLKEQKKYVQLF